MRPVLVVLCAALLSTMVGMYPVVFCGRSMLSPYIKSVFLFYQNPDGVPPVYNSPFEGPVVREYEDHQMSDAGAVLWAHWPYSVIQSRAILDDGELPLWNRYNSLGTPLLGQGQSMLGDPLHLLTVLARGAIWSWDIKFVVARILWSFGVGLCVLLVTRHTPAAAVTACLATFIGFFTYRMNHPAIFSLCYSPWILFCWLSLTAARTQRGRAAWAAMLVAANWMQINSGTVKEAYMLMLCLNATGMALTLAAWETWRACAWRVVHAAVAMVAFAAVSAPLWFTFFQTLTQAATVYDTPGAMQVQPSLAIGFFDDIFYRQLMQYESVYLPSASMAILVGVAWALAGMRARLRDARYTVMVVSAAVTACIIFGVVPPSWITKAPFINRIIHIDNTFSTVLIVYCTILCGYGICRLFSQSRSSRWWNTFVIANILIGILIALFLGAANATNARATYLRTTIIPLSRFFLWYAPAILIAAVAWQCALRNSARSHGWRRASWIVLAVLCFAALAWRHGQHVTTGLFDARVFNPQTRVDLRATSAALQWIRTHAGTPCRVVGFEGNLFPGFSAAMGTEGISGPDAIIPTHYRALWHVMGIMHANDWCLMPMKQSMPETRPIYNMLNVKYFVSMPDIPEHDAAPLRKVARLDFDVYQNDLAWPRAFFASRLRPYHDAHAFVNLVRAGGDEPFAAIEECDLLAMPELLELTAVPGTNIIVPAQDYRLTANTSSFSVNAPTAGVVVLSETYVQDAVHATLNGRQVPVIRLNHAFRGVYVREPGTYTVTFTYRPRYFGITVMVAVAGMLVVLAWMINPYWRS